MDESSVSQAELDHALLVFDLSATLSHEELERRYHDLLIMWNPHRYANLTNNPRKYMQMYRKGESMTKEVHAAYHVLVRWLAEREGRSSPSVRRPNG